MGIKDNPHSPGINPLDEEQVRQYEHTAKEGEDTLTELTVRTLLHTGLRAGEFAHLQEKWLIGDSTDDIPMLEVPERELCIGGAGNDHHVRGSEKQQDFIVACDRCRTRRDECWEPKTKEAARRIPVTDVEAYELLEDWLSVHQQIPLLHNGIRTRVREVAEQAGLSRKVTPLNLRYTYLVILAHKGMNERAIADVMGFSTVLNSSC